MEEGYGGEGGMGEWVHEEICVDLKRTILSADGFPSRLWLLVFTLNFANVNKVVMVVFPSPWPNTNPIQILHLVIYVVAS